MALLVISTSDNSITDTRVNPNGLLNQDDGEISADSVELGGITTPEGAKPLFSTTNLPIFATSGEPVYEGVVTLPDNIDGYQIVGEATITIDWSSSGISDLDSCSHWADNSGSVIGWGYGNGGLANDNYTAWWTGDNTSAGPETIALITSANARSSKETSPFQYKVHLNFYGDASSGTPTATVTITRGTVTLSKTITPSTNQGEAATISDPAVTITFAADGTPTSIA